MFPKRRERAIDVFYTNTCSQCIKDAGYRNGVPGDTGCPIVLEAILNQGLPAEWDLDEGTCDEFEPA